MHGSGVIMDGLRRSLCPAALHGGVLRRAAAAPATSLRAGRAAAQRIPPAPCPRLLQIRRYSVGGEETAEGYSREGDSDPDTQQQRRQRQRQRQQRGRPREGTWAERLLAPEPPSSTTLHKAPVDEIMAALTAMRNPRGWSFHGQDMDRHSRIVQLVEHLLGPRRLQPNIFIYECLMDAMADPQGSAEGVRKLFGDMGKCGMQPTAALCQSALEALAVHPDYVLRQEIVDLMRELWFAVDTPARQSVVLGLLRDGQYELAHARLTDMVEQGAHVDAWVFDIFAVVFGKLGFLDEMLQLLQRRRSMHASSTAARSSDVLTSLVYFALDVCSQSFHHAGTAFAWNAAVKNSLLQPPDGIVENVLGTAARHGDAKLAAEALDLISQRTRVREYHYEAAAEAFARGRDMAGAFRTLCIMKKNGIHITRGGTRVLYGELRRSPALVRDAEAAVRSLAPDGLLPMAAVGAVMEAMSELDGSEDAMGLYRDAKDLCGERPDSSLMQTLIVNSRKAETRRALASDYAANIAEYDDAVREQDVYETLIPACTEADEVDLAFRFARQAISSLPCSPPPSSEAAAAASAVSASDGGAPRARLGWLKPLVNCAVAHEDARIWQIVDELNNKEDAETTAAVNRVLQQTRLARRADELSSRRR